MLGIPSHIVFPVIDLLEANIDSLYYILWLLEWGKEGSGIGRMWCETVTHVPLAYIVH